MLLETQVLTLDVLIIMCRMFTISVNNRRF